MLVYQRVVDITTDMPFFSKLFAVMLAFFFPLQAIVYVIVFLVFVDMITAIYLQMQSCSPNTSFFRHLVLCFHVIQSHKLRRTISKLFFYIIALIAFFLFDCIILKIKPLENDILVTFSVTNLASILISITELTSIASNISKITGNPIFYTIMRIFNKKVHQQMNIDPQDMHSNQNISSHDESTEGQGDK